MAERMNEIGRLLYGWTNKFSPGQAACAREEGGVQ
jgi:hypothetical protein